jgi:hypothetical protein
MGRRKTRLRSHAAHPRLQIQRIATRTERKGGIIYRGRDEAPEQLVQDILSAGAGLSSPEAASLLANEGPRLVKQILIDELSVPFDSSPDHPEELDLTSEAGHSIPRIIHYKDRTGFSIERASLSGCGSPESESDRECDGRGLADCVASFGRTHGCLSPADLRRGVRARSDFRKNILYSGEGNHSGKRAASEAFSCTQRILRERAATASPWRTAPARAASTCSTSNFIPRRCWRRMAAS